MDTTSKSELKILILEDEPADAKLVEGTLREAGLKFVAQRVTTRQGFAEALDWFKPDIVLSDYKPPDVDIRPVLELVRKKEPRLPVIVVAGEVEEAATDLIKAGATDYVPKDHLARLPSAVQRAIIEAEKLHERAQAEQTLRESEEQFRAMSTAAKDAMITVDDLGRIVFWNDAASRTFGYTAPEAIGQDLHLLLVPARYLDASRAAWPQFAKDGKGAVIGQVTELAARRKDGTEFPIELSLSAVKLKGHWHALGIVRDISERKRAEVARRKSEASLLEAALQARRLIEVSLDPLVTIGPDGKITDVNEATVLATGATRQALIGSDFATYVTEPEKARAGYLEVYAKGFVKDYPLAIRHVSGKITDVLYNATVYRDDKGEVVGVFGAARDVTERKRVEKEREQYLKFFSLSTESMAIADPFGSFKQVNPAFSAMTGYTASELISRPFMDFIVPEDRKRTADEMKRQVSARPTLNFKNRYVRKDGAVIDLSWRAYFDKTDGITYAVARDITERKRAEAQIIEYSEHLEELVSQRTAELTKSNQALEAANQGLESFSYSVSHDLRAPLRAIDGFSRILLEDEFDKLDAEGQRLLNVVCDNAVKMGRLIDDILAFSRSTRGEMNVAPIDMDESVRSVIKELEPVLAGRKVTFDIKPLAAVQGDGAMIKRVWTNLIDNAVKFTALKPEAVIEIGSTVGDKETIYYVKDNGAGFDMQYVGKLFGVFQRLHGTEFAGTGIGLAIVKRIIAKHGGRMWAEGKVNEGATFYFTLPVLEETDI
jgi:PAS domain S-box-containing protein